MTYSYFDCGLYSVLNIGKFVLAIYLFKSLFNKDIEFSGYTIAAISVFYYLVNSAGFLWLSFSNVVYFLLYFIFIMLIGFGFKVDWKYRLFVVMLYVAIGSMCEDACHNIFHIFNNENDIVHSLLISNIGFAIAVIIVKKVVTMKSKYNRSSLEWILLVLTPIAGTILSSAILLRARDNLVAMVGALGLIFAMCLLLVMFFRKEDGRLQYMNNKALEELNPAFKHEIELLRQSEERIRAFRHDVKNHAIMVGELLKQKRYEELDLYVQKIVPEISNEYKYSNTGNIALDALVNIKLSKAKLNGVSIDASITALDRNRVSDNDIVIVLGNLLDNANEALEKCLDKKELNLVIKESKTTLYIRIKNSYSGEIKKIGSKFATTKTASEHKGIGLENVNRVVEKYNGTWEIKTTEKYFEVTCVLIG